MNHELLLFFCSMGTGICLLFVYDWIRILRKLFPHSSTVVSVVDFSYWIAGGIYIFSMMYRKNDGIIRSYAILGVLLGMTLYRVVFSEVFVNSLVKLLKIPIEFVKTIVKRLIFAVRSCRMTLYRFLRVPLMIRQMQCVSRNLSNTIHRAYNKKRLRRIGKKKSQKQSQEK